MRPSRDVVAAAALVFVGERVVAPTGKNRFHLDLTSSRPVIDIMLLIGGKVRRFESDERAGPGLQVKEVVAPLWDDIHQRDEPARSAPPSHI